MFNKDKKNYIVLDVGMCKIRKDLTVKFSINIKCLFKKLDFYSSYFGHPKYLVVKIRVSIDYYFPFYETKLFSNTIFTI